MIAIGSDHGGFELKQELMAHLTKRGILYKDYGTYSADSCDYPGYAKAVAHAVADGECETGILICGTGIGISITANKVKGIRCALVSDLMSARMTRQHNDTNMLAMGAAVLGEKLALEIADVWLSTDFEGGRHARRVNKIMEYEK